MATVYVVIGNRGEYSDYREWVVCAFAKEDKARRFAERTKDDSRDLASRFRAYEDSPEVWLTGEEWLKKFEFTPLDPTFDPGCYGAQDVDYTVVSCELRR